MRCFKVGSAILFLLLLGVAFGCDRKKKQTSAGAAAPAATSGGSPSAATGRVQREVVSDLAEVPVVHNIPVGATGGLLKWDVSVSPDGLRFALLRKTSYGGYRIDINGERGPISFDQPTMPTWSEDSSTAMYACLAKGMPQPGTYIVVKNKPFGPFAKVTRILPGNSGAAWYALIPSENGAAGTTLLVNGSPTPLSQRVDQIRLDASGAPIFASGQKWIDQRGGEVPEPPAPVVQNLPTVSVNIAIVPSGLSRKGANAVPKYQSLTVNKSTVGTFESIVTRQTPTGPRAGFQQPDGRIIFYVVENEQLVRLHVKP